MSISDAVQKMIDRFDVETHGPFVRLEYRFPRWVVVRVTNTVPLYTVVAGPFWRKRTAKVALQIQKAMLR